MILSNVDELSSGVMLQLCSILALLSGGRRDPAQTPVINTSLLLVLYVTSL